MFIFIAGTAGSGKSEYAEHRALGLSPESLYIATAEVRDADMLRKVELHRKRREGTGFTTIECPRNLGGLELPEDSCVLIESLTVWLANEMFTAGGVNHDAGGKVCSDFLRIRERVKHVVLVSDDVFSDGRDYDPLTEEYLRTLGGLHVRLAALADEVIECVSGIPLQYTIICS